MATNCYLVTESVDFQEIKPNRGRAIHSRWGRASMIRVHAVVFCPVIKECIFLYRRGWESDSQRHTEHETFLFPAFFFLFLIKHSDGSGKEGCWNKKKKFLKTPVSRPYGENTQAGPMVIPLCDSLENSTNRVMRVRDLFLIIIQV